MSEEGFLRKKQLNGQLKMKFTILTSKPILHRTPWKVLMIHVAAKSGKVANNTVCILGYTPSGVNIAEISPHLREAADAYLRNYIDLSVKLGAEWIVVHGGYHFTGCQKIRKQASIDRIKRAVDYAEKQNALLLLKNLNGEPELAEVHYMPDNLEDTQEYFEQIQSPNLRWSFTINHAHFDPIGIKGLSREWT